jgi:hypothetical protein
MKKHLFIYLKKLKLKSQIFLCSLPNNIRIIAFSPNATHIWYENTNIQFILDPYATTTYCRSCMTKINKNITS